MCRTQSQITTKEQSGISYSYKITRASLISLEIPFYLELSFFHHCNWVPHYNLNVLVNCRMSDNNFVALFLIYHGMSFSLVILIGCIIRPSTSCLRHNAGGRSTSRFDWNNHWWLPRFVWKLRIGQQNYYLTFYSSLRHLSYKWCRRSNDTTY
jgi:hypothetical protein